jgi:hypothetical protein
MQAIIELVEAAEGMSYGTDWNKGTHAVIHRSNLLKALSKLKVDV